MILNNKETVFPLFKKGNRVNSTQIKRVFYLSYKCKNNVYYHKTRKWCYRKILACSLYFTLELFRLKKTDTLGFCRTVHAKNKLENIRGPSCTNLSYKQGHYTPVIVSILYKAHSSSVSFAIKKVGGEIIKGGCVVLAEPMTLARF